MERPSLVEDALNAFQHGHYQTAKDILLGCQRCAACSEVLLLIGLRLRDYDLVWRAAVDLRETGETPDQRAIGEARMFYADVARNRTAEPFSQTTRPRTAVGKSEIALIHASIEWMRGSTDIKTLLSENPPQTLDQKIRRISIEAWIAELRGDIRRHAELLLNALSRALTGGLDAGAIMVLAHPVAALFREIDFGELAPHAEAILKKVPWGSVSTHDRFYGERAFAWRRALDGDFISALKHLDTAMLAAPDDLCRALSHIDSARIAVASNSHVHAQASIALAFAAFERVEWTAATHEEPLGLYGSLDILSVEPERARLLLDRAVAAVPTAALGIAHGSRLTAYRTFAEAAVATSPEEAYIKANAAYRLFIKCGYVFRASSAAVLAFEASGQRKWLERASELVTPYPRSILAMSLRQHAERPHGLTERRLQVLRGLCQGKTSQQVADSLCLSESTVRKHIGDLHRILGVTRRAELVLRAIELRLAA